MVLEIIIIKFSCILKTMFRNTIPEPQPDSASYTMIYNFIIPPKLREKGKKNFYKIVL